MIACQVIVPTLSGRSRLPWTENKIPDWEDAVAYLFGGVTPVLSGEVVGKWRNPRLPAHSAIVLDSQLHYKIVVATSRVAELRQFMLFNCVHFEQEVLFFQVGDKVEFLPNPVGWLAPANDPAG